MILGYRSSHKRGGEARKDTLKQWQITANSAQSFIEWAISIPPDGKYLAYVEKAGPLFLSSVETGEARILTPASGDLAPLGWFPDGTQLLAIKLSEHSLWKISVMTGALTKLRDNAVDGSISPDGSHIMSWEQGPDDFWIMGPAGEGSRRAMVVDPTDDLLGFSWAPTGQRFAFAVTRRRPGTTVDTVIESRDVKGRQPPL